MLGIAPSRAKDAKAAARTIGISSFWQPSLVRVELWMFRLEGICDMFTTHVFYSGKTTNCSSLKIEILKSSWDNFGIHAIGSRLIDSSTTCTDIKSKNAKDWMDWNASDQISMLHPRVNEPTKHKEMSGGFYTIWSEASWFPKNRMPMWPYNALIWLVSSSLNPHFTKHQFLRWKLHHSHPTYPRFRKPQLWTQDHDFLAHQQWY